MKEMTVALAGNPNVGKSTVFNSLTGLHQHTGNWPGKTVDLAAGTYHYKGETVHLIDLPGTYSLSADSPEEVIARDFIRGGQADVTLVVVDATCLKRSLNLAVQVRQLTSRMVLCVNLLDEAAKKNISVDLEALGKHLACPVVGTAARSGQGLEELKAVLAQAVEREEDGAWEVPYDRPVEWALQCLLPATKSRLAALELLRGEREAVCPEEEEALEKAEKILERSGWDQQKLHDGLTAAQVRMAERIGHTCTQCFKQHPESRDRRLDRLFTSRRTGIPAMLLLLAFIFYLTIWGANVPSEMLSRLLFSWQEPLRRALGGAPWWLQGVVVDGIYRTVAWVVSVMLPPMAIFFPLFTLLEDMGYLPRVAFNLDRFFRSAGAHGRQSLTMCMGFGCNACAVTGCRIIDGERERLIAILSNCLVPCNGRFPTLIVLITLFFLGGSAGIGRSLLATGIFLAVIVFAVCMTWAASRLLSATVLHGESPAFSLELPPYRMPQWGQVLVRSVLDRTLFVLLRAITVAAPAGALIWILGNVSVGESSLLSAAASLLEPLGRAMGVDGMILLAFLLGFPANEIVLPILMMGYLQTGSLTAYTGLEQLREILLLHGWTWQTALCVMVICLMHFPCGTTCLTIYRESGSLKWTALGILLPSAMGMAMCLCIHGICRCIM